MVRWPRVLRRGATAVLTGRLLRWAATVNTAAHRSTAFLIPIGEIGSQSASLPSPVVVVVVVVVRVAVDVYEEEEKESERRLNNLVS